MTEYSQSKRGVPNLDGNTNTSLVAPRFTSNRSSSVNVARVDRWSLCKLHHDNGFLASANRSSKELRFMLNYCPYSQTSSSRQGSIVVGIPSNTSNDPSFAYDSLRENIQERQVIYRYVCVYLKSVVSLMLILMLILIHTPSKSKTVVSPPPQHSINYAS